jgi:hypothetical protein
MLFRAIIAVCPENHTEHTNALCEQNAELLEPKAQNMQLPLWIKQLRQYMFKYCRDGLPVKASWIVLDSAGSISGRSIIAIYHDVHPFS